MHASAGQVKCECWPTEMRAQANLQLEDVSQPSTRAASQALGCAHSSCKPGLDVTAAVWRRTFSLKTRSSSVTILTSRTCAAECTSSTSGSASSSATSLTESVHSPMSTRWLRAAREQQGGQNSSTGAGAASSSATSLHSPSTARCLRAGCGRAFGSGCYPQKHPPPSSGSQSIKARQASVRVCPQPNARAGWRELNGGRTVRKRFACSRLDPGSTARKSFSFSITPLLPQTTVLMRRATARPPSANGMAAACRLDWWGKGPLASAGCL